MTETNYSNILLQSYKDYAKAVALERALPDMRDGLKPVQRRILYSMHKSGNLHNKPYRKSARIVGDVMGKLHPHGDSSIYEALVKMAQDFSCNIPLIDGQGNFGSIDGDGFAAMRYTEARLSEASNEFFIGIDKDTVEYIDNFDGTVKEPLTLPTYLPNLLLNGSSGIAVGIATNIPQFNLIELIEATEKMIQKKSVSEKDILSIIQGPDFPCGGFVRIPNKEKIFKEGTGTFEIYGKIEKENNKLIITEIPQTLSGNKVAILSDIKNKVQSGKIPEIIDVEDQSQQDIRVQLKCQKGTDLDDLIAKIYKYTNMKQVFAVNLTGTIDENIKEFNIYEYLTIYKEYIEDITRKSFIYDKKDILAQIEIAEGLIFANENIDLIIEVIRGAKKVQDAKKCLHLGDTSNIKFKTKKSEKEAKKLRLTENQCNSIMKMRLEKLVGLEKISLEENLKALNKSLDNLNNLLTNENEFKKYLLKTLRTIKRKYGNPRRTVIIDKALDDYEHKEEIIDVYALVDSLNYLKVVNDSSYQRIAEETLKEYKVFECKSNERLAVMTSDGSLNYISLKDLKITSMQDRGEPIENLIIGEGKVCYINTENAIYEEDILFISKSGYGKIIEGSTYIPTGEKQYRNVIGSVLKDKNDSYAYIGPVPEEIELRTDIRVLRINPSGVSKMGKNARGVRMINKKSGAITEAVTEDFMSSKVQRRGGLGIDIEKLKNK